VEPDPAVSAEAPWLRRRRRKATFAFVSLLALLGVLAAGFAVSSTAAEGPEGYLSFATAVDAPFEVISDPPTPTGIPRTDAILTASIASIALSLPSASAASTLFAAAEKSGLDPLTGRAQRTTVTSTGADGAPSTFINVALLLEDGYALTLAMSVDGTFVLDYDPPLIQLPADLTLGSTWSSEGITSGFAPFTYTGTVLEKREIALPAGLVDDPDRCVDVRTRLDQQIPGADGYVSETVSAWCPGRHIVASVSGDGTSIRQASPEEVTWPPTVPPAVAPQASGTTLLLPIASANLRRAPIASPGGLVAVNDNIGDVFEFGAREALVGEPAATTTLTWLQHPGGVVLGVAADAERIAVTTSRRTLVLFDHAGRLRWSERTPDVAAGSPAMLGDVVTVALADGSIRGFDIDSGEPRWSHRLSDVVTESPVVINGVFVAADSAGYILAVTGEGEVLWAGSTNAVSGPLSALPGDGVLIPQTRGVVTLLDVAGDETWSAFQIEGNVNALAERWGDIIAIPTSGGLWGLDVASGEVRWHLPEFTRSSLGPDGLLADGDRVVRIAQDGAISPVAEVREADGSEPLGIHLARMGGQWVAVTAAGAVTYVGEDPGE
jgi:outer membrane protein assembly factor BamB